MENGAFYSSCGPVIKDFYVDDENVVHIETSECEKIIFQCDKHPSRMVASEGEPLTSGEWNLKDEYEYIRATVIDEKGRRAWSNPIFLK